jgi:hypothetical protein
LPPSTTRHSGSPNNAFARFLTGNNFALPDGFFSEENKCFGMADIGYHYYSEADAYPLKII